MWRWYQSRDAILSRQAPLEHCSSVKVPLSKVLVHAAPSVQFNTFESLRTGIQIDLESVRLDGAA